MTDIYEYGLSVLESEKRKLENMIEIRLDRGEKEESSRFIKTYKEQMESIDRTITLVKKSLP